MILTGHELTGASSAVAAVAIIGGYLGVRSANQNALKVAREERSSKREDELNALKRATYVKLLASCRYLYNSEGLFQNIAAADAHNKLQYAQQMLAAYVEAINVVAEVALIAPKEIFDLGNKLVVNNHDTPEAKARYNRDFATLIVAMSKDLDSGLLTDFPHEDSPARVPDHRLSVFSFRIGSRSR